MAARLILLLNAGSSSLKASLLDADAAHVVAAGAADWARSPTRVHISLSPGDSQSSLVDWSGHRTAVEHILNVLAPVWRAGPPLAAVGHRIVHGGDFSSSALITEDVCERIAALCRLAPLHNPPSLEALAAARGMLPDVPHAACFDTAFHATLPEEARTYPVPRAWTEEWGIRRYGFHGLSHAYAVRRAAELLSRPVAELRLISCHLGHGCSAAAVLFGRCVDTTMGFTPLDGLMMATRSGAVDPGVILHVQREHGLSAEDVDAVLNRGAGLLGASGVSGDMRELLAAAARGHAHAALAIAMYCRRVRQTIGAYAATLGGVDAVIFTAGVGEHAADIRRDICLGLDVLGLQLDERANAACRPDADIAAAPSRGRILVVAAREDLTMLDDVRRLLETPV